MERVGNGSPHFNLEVAAAKIQGATALQRAWRPCARSAPVLTHQRLGIKQIRLLSSGPASIDAQYLVRPSCRLGDTGGSQR